MKNKTFLDSIKCAFNGLFYGLKTEKNFKYYTIIATIFLILNILIKATLMEFMFYGICIFGVFSAEFFNTSIEHLSNAFTKEIKQEIKITKDIAATGVLIWGLAFFIVEIFIIISKLI